MKLNQLFFVLILFVVFFGFVNSTCPIGKMANFDGSCIGDPNYNAGQVKTGQNSSSGQATVQTITVDYIGKTYDQLKDLWDNECRWGGGKLTQAQCDELESKMYDLTQTENQTNESSTIGSHKSIGDFSNEDLDQQNNDGTQLISDVDTIKQQVMDAVTNLVENYSYEESLLIWKIKDDVDAISGNEYSAARNKADDLGNQMSACGTCLNARDEECKCKAKIQREINISSYGHFMTSYQAQQDALNQLKDYLQNNPPQKQNTTIDNTNTDTTNQDYISQTNNIDSSNNDIPSENDSQVLMEVVAKPHTKELQDIQNHYNADFQKVYFIPPNVTDAQNELDSTVPLGIDVVNAKNDYQDAVNKGSLQNELSQLKSNYDSKMAQLQNNLQDVLDKDPNNPDALWQLGTLSKWTGDNKNSYDYYRDALSSEKTRNVFNYQKMLDSINNPTVKIQLIQDLNPQEKVINLPTVSTSPILGELKKNLNTLIQPLDDSKKAMAETIEKISRAFSISDKLDKAKKELGITFGDNKNGN